MGRKVSVSHRDAIGSGEHSAILGDAAAHAAARTTLERPGMIRAQRILSRMRPLAWIHVQIADPKARFSTGNIYGSGQL